MSNDNTDTALTILVKGEEADFFIAALRECFAGAKQARSQLRHPSNIAPAERFANALSAAWAQLIEEVL